MTNLISSLQKSSNQLNVQRRRHLHESSWRCLPSVCPTGTHCHSRCQSRHTHCEVHRNLLPSLQQHNTRIWNSLPAHLCDKNITYNSFTCAFKVFWFQLLPERNATVCLIVQYKYSYWTELNWTEHRLGVWHSGRKRLCACVRACVCVCASNAMVML